MEKCGNCHRNIGDLEDVFVVKDQPVCAECYKRLAQPAVETAIKPIATNNDAGLLLAGAVLRGAGIVIGGLGILGIIIGMFPVPADSYDAIHPGPSMDTRFLVFILGVALFGGGSWMIKAVREGK